MDVSDQIASQSPHLYILSVLVLSLFAANIAVVRMFLRHIKEAREGEGKREEACHLFQQSITARTESTFEKVAKAMTQNASALATTAEVLRDVRETFDHLPLRNRHKP